MRDDGPSQKLAKKSARAAAARAMAMAARRAVENIVAKRRMRELHMSRWLSILSLLYHSAHRIDLFVDAVFSSRDLSRACSTRLSSADNGA